MYLNFNEIYRLITKLTPPLVEGLDEYQIKPISDGGVVEGPCIELRIGKIFSCRYTEVPILDYDFSTNIVRYAPDVNLVLDYQVDGLGKELILKKGEGILVETIEKINLPNQPGFSLISKIIPRFSLTRMGVLMLNSDADPGYHGKFVLGLINIGLYDKVKIGTGARIAKLRFINVNGENPSYVGKYGGKPGNVLEKL